jgi:hypothetical protein
MAGEGDVGGGVAEREPEGVAEDDLDKSRDVEADVPEVRKGLPGLDGGIVVFVEKRSEVRESSTSEGACWPSTSGPDGGCAAVGSGAR